MSLLEDYDELSTLYSAMLSTRATSRSTKEIRRAYVAWTTAQEAFVKNHTPDEDGGLYEVVRAELNERTRQSAVGKVKR